MKILEEIARELDGDAPGILYRQDLAAILRKFAAAHDEDERVRKDAERYRWLRNEAVWAGSPKGEGGEMCWVVIGTDAYRSHPVDGVELDEAVDAAMQGANA